MRGLFKSTTLFFVAPPTLSENDFLKYQSIFSLEWRG